MKTVAHKHLHHARYDVPECVVEFAGMRQGEYVGIIGIFREYGFPSSEGDPRSRGGAAGRALQHCIDQIADRVDFRELRFFEIAAEFLFETA